MKIWEEAGLGGSCAVEVNRLAAQIARRACDKFETPERPRYVIGSVGPTRKLLSAGTNDLGMRECKVFSRRFRDCSKAGWTCCCWKPTQDMLAIKCAIAAANLAFEKVGRRVPDHGAGLV